MAKNQKVVKVILQSTESTYRYHTTKNKQTMTARLEKKKYDPILRKHVLFRETK
jgi:large subunit ribosomal protein L33